MDAKDLLRFFLFKLNEAKVTTIKSDVATYNMLLLRTLRFAPGLTS